MRTETEIRNRIKELKEIKNDALCWETVAEELEWVLNEPLMTVTKLRKLLQNLEEQGKGNYEIESPDSYYELYNIECHDNRKSVKFAFRHFDDIDRE